MYKPNIKWFFIATVFSSCATYNKIKPYITPYRATVGISAQTAEFKKKKQRVCVGESPEIKDNTRCSGGGFKTFTGKAYFDPWIEFKPNYFGESSFGWSQFLRYDSVGTSLIDYPNDPNVTDIRIRRIGLNPFVYYNLGKKFQNGKGFSFRLGVGASLGYVVDFQLEQRGTNTVFSDNNSFNLGFSSFVEVNFFWFVFRISHSQSQFDALAGEKLRLESNKVSILYAYYF